MKKLNIVFGLFVIGCVAVLSPVAMAQDHVDIIVNANNPISSLTRTELVQIFKGVKTSWDDGSKIVLVVQEEEEPGFSDLIDMSKRKYDKYWISVALSGKANPPKRVAGDAAALSYVAREKDSIGYVSSAAGVGGVKAVSIIE